MQFAHPIDFSDPAIKGDGAAMARSAIVRFVEGIRRPRSAPVTARQIKNWLKHTPDDFVDRQIDAALSSGKIRIYPRSLGSTRRATGGYVYAAAE